MPVPRYACGSREGEEREAERVEDGVDLESLFFDFRVGLLSLRTMSRIDRNFLNQGCGEDGLVVVVVVARRLVWRGEGI